ncbi:MULTISPECIES: DUF397 domain-containing protein [unclassified Streptomyces]|uniref:DUF397 domain-containing protein n=1 Tax=unclassified Streptomyces TaxID=2593676 RepID=UPI0008DCC7BE|nr:MULTISPECIES: DUF397 domain-containing protein [unclassified Streptomyces]OII70701.1 DUF397 domain-containing protein [Streptomyces sp. CC77]
MSSTLQWFKSSYSSSSGGECVEVAFDWRTSSYSSDSGGNCVEVAAPWRTSTRSSSSGGDCVEVAACADAVHVRDSKNPDGGTFAVAPSAWVAFLAGATGS